MRAVGRGAEAALERTVSLSSRQLPVTFSTAASQDVETAKRWLEEVAPALGVAFLEELGGMVQRLTENPQMYQPFGRDARRAVMRRFDYAVVYRVLPDRLQVVAVMHCRLDPAKSIVRSRAGVQ